MPLIPDLPWTADHGGDGPGVVVTTSLHLRRLRDVPGFFRTSLAIRSQTMRSPGARSLVLRAQLARELSVDGGDLACFTFDTVAKRNAFIARCANRRFSRPHCIRGPRGQHDLAAGENGVTGLWCFVF